MNRILRRPMFRIGGSAGTGITSGLDRKPFQQGTDPYDRALKTTERAMTDLERFRGEKQPLLPGTIPAFLTQFGLNLASATPTGTGFGGLISTAAKAAQEPFQTFQAATLAERDDKFKTAEDIFSGALASEYDLKAKEIGAKDDDRKTPEVERSIIESAQNNIYAARDILNDKDSTAKQKQDAERTIRVNQNVLVKELGVPVEYAAIISEPQLFDAEMTTVVNTYNQEQDRKRKDYLDKNQDKTAEDAIALFPFVVDGTAEARALTFEDLKRRFYYNKGGRVGYRAGSEPMMESVASGQVKDLSYTELRARLPQEISNDIVQLLANSKQALLDFANIQTAEDISNFNTQYDVNLTLPQGA